MNYFCKSMKLLNSSLFLSLILLFLSTSIIQAQVNLDKPATASTNIESTVALWAEYEGSSAYTYQLQLSTDSTFVQIDISDTNKRYYVIVTGLKLNTKYFWKMRRWKGTDTSSWSTVWNFITSDKPTIQGPRDGGSYVEFTPIYLHRTNHYSYEIQIDTNSSFNSPALSTIYDIDTGKTYDLQLFYSGFYYNQKHLLRFRTFNTGDTSPWSAVNQFDITFKLDKQLVFNKPEASPAFNWTRPFTNESSAYEIKIDTSPLFNSGLLRQNTFSIKENNRDQPLAMGAALYNTKYYWTVRAMNSKDTSDWVDADPFTTGKHPISLSVPFRFYPNQELILQLDTFVKKAKIFYDTALTENKSPNLKYIEITPTYSSNDNTRDTIQLKNLFYNKNYFLTIQLFNGEDSINSRNNQSFATYAHSNMNDPYSFRNYGTRTLLVFDTNYNMGTYFRVQLDSNSNFSTPIVDSIYTTDKGFDGKRPLAELEFSKKYYWRVKNAHEKDTSLWSNQYSLNSFETFTAPTLTSPSNNIKLNTLNFKLQWERVYEQWSNINNIIYYQLQYDTSLDFNSPELKNEYILDNAQNSDSAYCKLFNTKYYWRVRIYNSMDTSIWSQVRNFITADQLFRIEPEDGDTNILPSFIDWLSIEGTKGYILYFDTSKMLNSTNNKWVIEKNRPFFHSFFENNTTLDFNTQYHFKLGVFTEQDTLYGDTISFTTRKRNGVILSSPANSALDQSWQTLLRWNAFPTSSTNQYLIELSNFEDMRDSTTYSSTGLARSVILQPAQTYYWRVRAMFNDVTPSSDYSVVWNFSTKDGLDSVVLNIPADSAILNSDKFNFRWFNVTDAQSYDLQIGFDANFLGFRPFNSVLLSQNVDLLSDGTRYYWRVRAKSNGVNSSWSEIRTFEVKLPTNVYQIENNGVLVYPNPNNGNFIIKSNNGPIDRIEIYNSNGVLVYKNDYNLKQSNQVITTPLSKGVYFVKTHLKDQILTTRIIIQ